MRIADIDFAAYQHTHVSDLFVVGTLLKELNTRCEQINKAAGRVIARTELPLSSIPTQNVEALLREFNLTHHVFPDFTLLSIYSGVVFDLVPSIVEQFAPKRAALALEPVYYCAHIRRTDKIGTEAKFHASKEYIDRVMHYAALHTPYLKKMVSVDDRNDRESRALMNATDRSSQTTFVVSDEKGVQQELRALRYPPVFAPMRFAWNDVSAAASQRARARALFVDD